MSYEHPDLFAQGSGTTQGERLPKALHPRYVRIDERDTADLLAFSASYSKLVRFFNEMDEEDGTWEDFFLRDISTLLSVIIATDLEQVERTYSNIIIRFLQSHEDERKAECLGDLIRHLFSVFRQVDEWYRRLQQLTIRHAGLERTVEAEYYNLIKLKWAKDLQLLRSCLHDLQQWQKEIPGLDLRPFDPIWKTGEDPGTAGETSSTIDTLAVKLRLLYRSVHDNLSYMVYSFQRYFTQSLEQKADHKPDIGLFISFLRVFGHAQHALNQLSDKFLELYYSKILSQKHLDSIPDQVHVYFDLAEQVPSYTLEKGTLLTAGIDDQGQEILYRTESAVELNQAQVASLKTLYLHKDSRETISNYEVVTHFYAAPVANSQDGLGTPFDRALSSWPTFGENQFDKIDGAKNMVYAETGFAVSSPLLFLREGNRQVSMTFHFDPGSTRIYEKLVKDVMEKLELRNEEEAFYKVFNPTGKVRNITVYLSGSRGWIKVDPQRIKVTLPDEWTAEQFTLNFSLDSTDPAVVGFDGEIFPEERFNTPYPVVKVVFNHEREPYGYSFIRFLKVKQIDLKVEVDRLKNFQLYSDLGPLDATQPFQPFGATPSVGSHLLIGAAELFQKPLTSFTLKMNWHDLPRTAEEFEKYYRDYHLRAEDYKVSLSALSRNEFYPIGEDSLTFSLFFPEKKERGERDEEEVLLTEFQIDESGIEKLKIVPEPDLPSLNDYSNETASGYLKIELEAPDMAFGHDAYQSIITRAMTQNAKLVADSVKNDEPVDSDQLAVPNSPQTPVAHSLSIRYTASSRIDLEEEIPEYPQQFFHVYPFGVDKVFPMRGRASKEVMLVPQFAFDGYLYIGLRDIKPLQTVSLFFQLIQKSAREQTILRIPESNWSYLSRNNEWKEIAQSGLLSDTTDHFTRSGIIRIKLPADASFRGSVLPDDLYWLRVGVTGDVEMLCHTIAIHTQAVSAEWVDNGDPDRMRKVLPPYTVSDLVEKRPEVREVIQPFESFGGKARENDQEFFARVSERLRHKDRAVTHWDFERLVLHRFHDLFQVRCLSHLSHPEKEGSEGEEGPMPVRETRVGGIRKDDGVVLVVVPRRTRYLEDLTPSVNYKKLMAVEDYVRNFASPFIKVKARNPEYEYIRVVCKVKFADAGNSGHSIEQLKERIKTFLCPWYDDSTREMKIGGHVYLDALKNYLSALPFVKFITKFSLIHIIEEDNGDYKIEDTADGKSSLTVIYASKPWAVLIPDEDHVIELIEGEEREEAPEKIQPPLSFKNKYNILKRTTFIKVKGREGKRADEEGPGEEGSEFQLTIKL